MRIFVDLFLLHFIKEIMKIRNFVLVSESFLSEFLQTWSFIKYIIVVMGIYHLLKVKSEIHSSISRQLEALRNREVWLLNQVELIQNMKDEVLHIQQARLNKMLGVAQSCLTESMGNKL